MQRNYSRTKLVDYIVDQLQAEVDLNKLAQSVAAYLIEVNKVSDLDSVMRDAQELRAQKYGVVELTARSAHPLEASHLNQIEQIAKQQYSKTTRVITHQEHDDKVIGGTNLTFPHANLDVTVRGTLNQLREAIS